MSFDLLTYGEWEHYLTDPIYHNNVKELLAERGLTLQSYSKQNEFRGVMDVYMTIKSHFRRGRAKV